MQDQQEKSVEAKTGEPPPPTALFHHLTGNRVRFLEAATYPYRALVYIIRNPGLWLYLIIPVLLNIIVGVWTWNLTGNWIRAYMQDWVVVGWLQEWLILLKWALIYLVQFLVSVFAMMIVGNLLVIPFNEWLSERVDKMLGWNPNSNSITYQASLRHMFLVARYELSRMSIYVSIMIPLGLMSLFTAVAWITIPAKMVVTMIFLAMDNFSYSLDRRGHAGIDVKFKFLFSRFMACLGFGAGMTLFLLIPLINFIFLPVGAIGATMLYHHMNPDGEERSVRSGTGS